MDIPKNELEYSILVNNTLFAEETKQKVHDQSAAIKYDYIVLVSLRSTFIFEFAKII